MGFFDNLFGGGAGDANKEYQKYLNKAMDEMRQHETQGRQDITGYTQQALGYEQPYREAGQEGLQGYMATLGYGGKGAQQGAIDKFTESPGYQYALNQGLTAVQRGEAASGMTGSGAEQAELQKRGQGMAQQEYGGYQDRLANLAGMGQQSSSRASQLAYGEGGELANLGYGYAGQESNLYGQMGESAAESQMAQSSGLGKFLGTAAGGIANIAQKRHWFGL